MNILYTNSEFLLSQRKRCSLNSKMGGNLSSDLKSSKYRKREIVDLRKMEIDKLPPTIGALLCKELLLAENDLTTLPEEIGKLSNVQVLDVSKNRITSIPLEIEELSHMVSLTELDLKVNPPLSYVPSLANLRQLKKLSIRNLQISHLPMGVGLLSELQELDMRDNPQLKEVPYDIGTLINLQRLDLFGNNMRIIPREIGNLINLQSLDLRQNQLLIDNIPQELGRLVNLKKLSLSGNRLVALPAEVCTLTNLKELECANNQLQALPNEIGQLVALTKVNFSANKLTTLPASIGDLVELQLADFKSNEIADLPETLGGWKNVTKIDLSHNMLTELPWELGQLEGTLTILDVGHNPLTIPPNPIVIKGTEAIVQWLKKNEKEGRKGKVSGLEIQQDDDKKK
ncbi:leucine-rich repeat-containing protein [Cavenderia fasciculata]|uniref:Leucine-rich repeat-containing protein n=1 Tax=Cavenderia fasciculata TaxID=261658 RepID=F4Q4T4_CACFS|nr:leucine-rich repeat-containing protein [Cavenderia fasciculata]EGG17880.1 leucine-rich repeat-containing protein [Cavenderia fasciculata]|eukprot:XP_004356364.1 leucine-rich repeat-containing protein [Cavenderia fasciculata]